MNIIRITTFLESNGSVAIKHLTLRFGTRKDRILNKSGLFVYLNDEGKLISNAFDDLGLNRGDTHPNTRYIYKELHLPSLSEAIEQC